MTRRACETDRRFPGGYRLRTWTEVGSGLQCDVAPAGPFPVQVVEVSCTRVRYGRTVTIRGVVATPPPNHRAAFAAEWRVLRWSHGLAPRQDWTWPPEPLKIAPVEARSSQIVHVRGGRQNIGAEVEVTELCQPTRRVDDGTVEITITLR